MYVCIITPRVCQIWDVSVVNVEVWLMKAMKATADWLMALEVRCMTSVCSPAEGAWDRLTVWACEIVVEKSSRKEEEEEGRYLLQPNLLVSSRWPERGGKPLPFTQCATSTGRLSMSLFSFIMSRVCLSLCFSSSTLDARLISRSLFCWSGLPAASAWP